MKKFGTNLFVSNEFQNQLTKLSFMSPQNNNKLRKSPNSFDGRVVWRDYLKPIIEQNECISCWAFVSTYVLASRLSIYSLGKYNFTLSPSKMIFTDKFDIDKVKSNMNEGKPFDYMIKNEKLNINKCRVDSLLYAWKYLFITGVPESSCLKNDKIIHNLYTAKQLFGSSYDTCPTDNNEMIHHRINGYYYVPGATSKNNYFPDGNEENIRNEIYHWGPVSSCMKIFNDFLNWDGKGIYIWNKKEEIDDTGIGLSVVIIGWGEENLIPYWIVQTSWSKSWGDNGCFKIVRGYNHCEIEENVVVGFPTLPSIRLFIEYPILYSIDDFILRSLWSVNDNGYKTTSIEKVILNKPNKYSFDNTYFMYDPSSWTDFSKMIAGDSKTFHYNLKSKEDFMDDEYDIVPFCNNYLWYLLLSIVVLILLIYKYS
jgi:cathepsin B